MPTLSGVEVVRRVRTYVPGAVVAAQCEDSGGVARLVEAGARAVFTRRIPPADLADRMVACLTEDVDLPLAVC